jgi:hypothetical protein
MHLYTRVHEVRTADIEVQQTKEFASGSLTDLPVKHAINNTHSMRRDLCQMLVIDHEEKGLERYQSKR